MYKIYIFMQKKLIRILARALHEYVNFVHDPEKQYRSLSACWNTGVLSILVVQLWRTESWVVPHQPHAYSSCSEKGSWPRRHRDSVSRHNDSVFPRLVPACVCKPLLPSLALATSPSLATCERLDAPGRPTDNEHQ